MEQDLIPGIPEARDLPPLFDETDPRSLINVVWVDLKAAIKRVVDTYPDLFLLSETRITKKADPDLNDRMVRLRFWQQYDIAQASGKRMKSTDCVSGITFPEYWSRHCYSRPELLAYILTPPPKYVAKMETMLDIGLDNLLEILELPIKDSSGKVDTRLIGEKVKIIQMLDIRVKGAVMQKVAIHQRIDQHTQITEGTGLEKMDLTDLTALDAGIQKVKAQIQKAQTPIMIGSGSEVEVIDLPTAAVPAMEGADGA